MGKWLIGGLALVGGMFLITAYLPSCWSVGIQLGGHTIPYAWLMLLGLGYVVYRMKGK